MNQTLTTDQHIGYNLNDDELLNAHDVAYMYLCGKNKIDCARIQLPSVVEKFLQSGLFTDEKITQAILQTLNQREYFQTCISNEKFYYVLDEGIFLEYPDPRAFKLWIENCKHNMLAIMLFLLNSFPTNSMMHANMIIINKITKEIEHFEPHGDWDTDDMDVMLYRNVQMFFSKEVGLDTYTYIPPSQICPNTSIGVQAIIGNSTKHLKTNYKLTCTIWSIWYMYIRFQNPFDTAQVVYSNALKEIHNPNDPQQILQFIINFTYQLISLINIDVATVWRCGDGVYGSDEISARNAADHDGCIVTKMQCPVTASSSDHDMLFCIPDIPESQLLFYRAYMSLTGTESYTQCFNYKSVATTHNRDTHIQLVITNIFNESVDNITFRVAFIPDDGLMVPVVTLSASFKDFEIIKVMYKIELELIHGHDNNNNNIQINGDVIASGTYQYNANGYENIQSITFNEEDTDSVLYRLYYNNAIFTCMVEFISQFARVYVPYFFWMYVRPKRFHQYDRFRHVHNMIQQLFTNIKNSTRHPNNILNTVDYNDLIHGIITSYHMNTDEKVLFPEDLQDLQDLEELVGTVQMS